MLHITRSGAFNLWDCLNVVDGRVYRIKVAWDKEEGFHRVWLDGEVQALEGRYKIPLSIVKGMERLTLHTASCFSAKQTSIEKKKGIMPTIEGPSLTYWGRFRIWDKVIIKLKRE